MSCNCNNNPTSPAQVYATKVELGHLEKELKRIDSERTVTAIQSGKGGDTIPVGTDHTIHLDYEGWVESTVIDAAGDLQVAFNDSPNAVSAAAVADSLRHLRKEINRLYKGYCRTHIAAADVDGFPAVAGPITSGDLYLVPAKGGYKEYLALDNGDPQAKVKVRWELVGANDSDEYRGEIDGLNKKIDELASTLHSLAEAVKTSNDNRKEDIATLSGRISDLEAKNIPTFGAGDRAFTREDAGQLRALYQLWGESVDIDPLVEKIEGVK